MYFVIITQYNLLHRFDLALSMNNNNIILMAFKSFSFNKNRSQGKEYEGLKCSSG